MGRRDGKNRAARDAALNDLLLFNLAADADDPLLNFALGWVNRLASRFRHIDVVTMRQGRLTLPSNVTVWSVGKEKGYSEFRRMLEFYRILFKLRRQRRYVACFAHMMPLFTLMGAPVLPGIPITLWYAHRQPGRVLQWATKVSKHVVTSVATAFPLKTPKLIVIGQGIDTDFFAPDGTMPDPVPYIVHVARLMPIKEQASLIRALTDLPEAHAVFIGEVPPEADTAYKDELMALANQFGVADRVTFTGALSPEQIRAWHRRATAAVNLSPVGLFDKAALESMSVGLPTLVTNEAFDPLLGADKPRLYVPDLKELANQLRVVLSLPQAERAALGGRQREGVIRHHSLNQLIDRLTAILEGSS